MCINQLQRLFLWVDLCLLKAFCLTEVSSKL